MRTYTIIQDEQESYFSKQTYDICLHEPIGGKNKKASEKEGLCIWVTKYEHWWLHNTHEGELKDAELSILCQKVWMEQNDNNRNKWYNMFYQFYEE